jgi:hypothetical protein
MPNVSDYFIGTWELSKVVNTKPVRSFPSYITFSENGGLTHNVKVEGQQWPELFWSYDQNNEELTFYLPEKETYKIVERSTRRFKLRVEYSGNFIIFEKK